MLHTALLPAQGTNNTDGLQRTLCHCWLHLRTPSAALQLPLLHAKGSVMRPAKHAALGCLAAHDGCSNWLLWQHPRCTGKLKLAALAAPSLHRQAHHNLKLSALTRLISPRVLDCSGAPCSIILLQTRQGCATQPHCCRSMTPAC